MRQDQDEEGAAGSTNAAAAGRKQEQEQEQGEGKAHIGVGEEEEEEDEDEDEEEEEEDEEEEDMPFGQWGDRTITLQITTSWASIFDVHFPDEIMVYHESGIYLTREKLRCLMDSKWLTDEVINLYMAKLQCRDQRIQDLPPTWLGHEPPHCYFFNSFFINKLYKDTDEYDYAGVEKWTAPDRLADQGFSESSILDFDRLVMPVHWGVHWACCVVHLIEKKFVYYDSMGGNTGRAHMLFDMLERYLDDESKAKKGGEPLDSAGWRREFPPETPRQEGVWDCGVFAIKFADCAGLGLPVSVFSQADVSFFRRKIAAECLAGELEY